MYTVHINMTLVGILYRILQDPVRSHRILNGNNPNQVSKDPTQDPVKSSRKPLKQDLIGSYRNLNKIL